MVPTGICACTRRAALIVTSSEASNSQDLRRGTLIVTFIGFSCCFASNSCESALLSVGFESEQLTVQRRVIEALLGKRLHVDHLFGDQGPCLEDRIFALARTVVKGKGPGGPSYNPKRAGSLHLCCGLQ